MPRKMNVSLSQAQARAIQQLAKKESEAATTDDEKHMLASIIRKTTAVLDYAERTRGAPPAPKVRSA